MHIKKMTKLYAYYGYLLIVRDLLLFIIFLFGKQFIATFLKKYVMVNDKYYLFHGQTIYLRCIHCVFHH